MKKSVIGIIILSLLFLPVALAQVGKTTIKEGKLSAYGEGFVKVNGEKIILCQGCRIFDELGHEISIDGLVATETVRVVIVEPCAIEVKALVVRK